MDRTYSLPFAAVLAMLTVPCVGLAADKADGRNEISGMISYADIDYGSGVDSQETDIRLSYGRYLTDMHEIGVSAGYFKQEIEDVSADGGTLGAFYALNFPTSGPLTPYVGVNAAFITGDLGDLYDFQYGASAGLKIYPFTNGGFSVGLAYQKLTAAEDYIDDADGFSVAMGLLLRF